MCVCVCVFEVSRVCMCVLSVVRCLSIPVYGEGGRVGVCLSSCVAALTGGLTPPLASSSYTSVIGESDSDHVSEALSGKGWRGAWEWEAGV